MGASVVVRFCLGWCVCSRARVWVSVCRCRCLRVCCCCLWLWFGVDVGADVSSHLNAVMGARAMHFAIRPASMVHQDSPSVSGHRSPHQANAVLSVCV